MFRYFYISFLIFLVFTASANAQLIVSPLHYVDVKPIAKHRVESLSHDTLSLPFFEDFSRWNDSLWVPDSPVLINNKFCIFPPSLGVATFDGVNAKGSPFDFSSEITHGKADSLVALPINLSLLPSDSIYLSFYWQGGGLGDYPGTNDSIALYFKSNSPSWDKIWSVTGDTLKYSTDTSNFFKQVIIPITDSIYLYKGFSFKFVSYGSLSGQYDIWNIDYIYLNKNRTKFDTIYDNVGFTSIPGNILRSYTSVPIEVFRSESGVLVRDSVEATVQNIGRNSKTLNHRLVIQNNDSVEVFYTSPVGNTFVDTMSSATLRTPLSQFFIPDSISKITLRSSYILDSADAYTINDTSVGYTHLSDFYSFDDHSAELALSVNQNEARMAARYVVTTADTLTAIRMHFPKIFEDISNRNIRVTVWKSISDAKDSIIYSSLMKVGAYPDSLNKFSEYNILDSTIILQDTFYIGFSQSSESFIFLGLDRNTDARSDMFYNTNQKWNNIPMQGALMINPVFGTKKIIASIGSPSLPLPNFNLFPNPSSGIITISPVHDITIFDLLGRAVFHNKNLAYTLDLSFLREGIYFLTGTENLSSIQVFKKISIIK